MGHYKSTVITPAACDPNSDETLDALIGLASKSADWTERNARYLLDKVTRIHLADTWARRLKGEPKTWERFCIEVLGYPVGYLNAIEAGVIILEAEGKQEVTIRQALSVAERADTAKPIAQHRRPTKEEQSLKGDNVTLFSRGNSADFLTARIARDRPDIHERMKAGEYRSVRQAALEAGIVKPAFTCPADPDAAARTIKRHFDTEQRRRLAELLLQME